MQITIRCSTAGILLAAIFSIMGAAPAQAPAPQTAVAPRAIKPSLKFKTAAEFEAAIGEPAVLLDGETVCFFAPKRREREARIVLEYLERAYAALREITGVDTNYKMAVFAFPKGHAEGWGGAGDSSIEYDDANLDFESQEEWRRHKVPHVSGYIEEMAHSFVHATKAQFGWEMVGWSLGIEATQKVAPNPIFAAQLRETRRGQEETFNRYFQARCVFPADLPANQCDRIHAWILYQCSLKAGPDFWKTFFTEVRRRKAALDDAVNEAGGDAIRNARYRITIECFDQIPGLGFKKILTDCGVSLTTDVKSLHPETPGWNRRLTEKEPSQP